MTSEIPKKQITQYVRLFSQRTSIRGIPKIENSKLATIQWFWGIFILIAHVIMITLVVLLIMKYFQHDKTIKMKTSKIGFSDFPEVTICSKRFFSKESNQLPNPFDYFSNYSRNLSLQIRKVMKTDIRSAIVMLKTKFTTSLFFQTNYKFIQQWTYDLSNNLKNSCAIIVLDGKMDKKDRNFNCHIKPIFNPNYLNCLAFSIPRQSASNTSSLFRMEINIKLLKTPTVMDNTFKMDEYISDMLSDGGYQDIKIYMHKVDDYPFEFDFEVPFNCRGYNIYIVEKKKENQYYTGGIGTCNLGEFNTIVYGAPYKATRATLCESLLIQEKVKEKCKCFTDKLPNNVVTLCDYNRSFYNCLASVMDSSLMTVKSSCLPQCSKIHYTVLHKVRAIYSSSFSKKIHSLFKKTYCRTVKNSCKNSVNCIIKELFTKYTNVICTDSVNKGTKRGLSQTTTLPPQTSKLPPTMKEELNFNLSKKCKFIEIKIKMRKKMKVLTESLIVELNTLLSQLGGICAFFTGLTFTLIAEILETCIFWIHDKVRAQNHVNGH